MSATSAVIVLTTWPAVDTAGDPESGGTDASSARGVEFLAQTLVEERLAACVNVLPPMRSFYTWKGEVQNELEHQCVIKTPRERLPALEARLAQLHPYEVPELLVIDVAGGSEAYLAWVAGH